MPIKSSFYRAILCSLICVVISISLSIAYSQNQNSEDPLSASDKKGIADIINRTFYSSHPIEPEDIQVDSGRPTTLKQSTPQILPNDPTTELPEIAQARSYLLHYESGERKWAFRFNFNSS